jgi:hypothetical protein
MPITAGPSPPFASARTVPTKQPMPPISVRPAVSAAISAPMVQG